MASRVFTQGSYLRKCVVLVSSQGISKHSKLFPYRQIFNSRLNHSMSSRGAPEINTNVPKEPNFSSENTVEGASQHSDEKIAIKLAKLSDPDTFGTLNPQKTKQLTYEKILDELPDEEGDVIVETYADPETQRHRLKIMEYLKMIDDLIKAKRIRDAIDVLEVKMLKEDRAKPTFHIYNHLITACGHAGYTKKAFKLYNDMKKRGVRPNGGTYTSLFNACANCPFPGYGFQQAKHLKALMDEKSIFIRPITYHAMIKAFGRCGAVDIAFSLVDEMIEKKLPLSADTFCFVLQACISDKEAGFRLALVVWHKLRRKWIKPDIYNYNLLLRTVRECGTGDLVTFQQAIDEIMKGGVPSPEEHKLLDSPASENNSNLPSSQESSSLSVDSIEPSNVSENISPVPSISDATTSLKELPAENRPNLLTYKPHLGSILSLNEIKTPQDRLILLGGVNGILEEMEKDGLKPNDVTFGLLLDCIPPTLTAEKALLSIIKKENIKLRIPFYNSLIKRRALRFDYASARDVMTLLRLHHVEPDIMTFGALALSCRKKGEAEDLLRLMKEAEFHPNIEILGAMMRHACIQYSFGYIVYLMKYVKEEEIEVNELFLKHLQTLHNNAVKAFKILHKSKKTKENANIPDFFRSQTFQESFTMFQKFYTYWLKTIKKDPQVHPWAEVKQKRKTAHN